MKILLLSHVPKIGSKGAVVEVSDGYAKNALFPKKLAIPATPEIVKNWELKKQKEQSQKEERKEIIKKIIPELQNHIFEFKVRAGKNNEVFTSIHQNEVGNAIEKFLSEKYKLVGPEDIHVDIKPIKDLGEHTIQVRIGREDYIQNTRVIIKIIADK